LDPIGTRRMKDLILKLKHEHEENPKKRPKTIIMCSHLLADVQDVCDRIGILHQGELKELGAVESLLTVRDVTEFRVSGLSEAGRQQVEAAIRAQNGDLVSVGNPTATLEDLFLRVIEESEAHPGRRVHGGQSGNGKGDTVDGS
jgi:ABC-2 type transport system ATP-binding protein